MSRDLVFPDSDLTSEQLAFAERIRSFATSKRFSTSTTASQLWPPGRTSLPAP